MHDDSLHPEKSLRLIYEMIDKTKQDLTDDSVYFLIWGWVTFAGFAGQFILKRYVHFDQHYLVWLLIIPAAVASAWQGRKDQRTQKVSTFVGESMRNLWLGMGICFFVLSMIFSRLGWGYPVYPFFIVLYGLGTFVSGQFLKYRPLVWGGVAAWGLAIGAAYVEYDFQMLFGAAAILVSYIIPATLLRNARKHQNN